MRKQQGQINKQAREAAAATLAGFQSADVKKLKEDEARALLLALLQLLGLADDSGKIK